MIICDATIPSERIYPKASIPLDWVEEKQAQELVVSEGFPVRGIPKDRETFCAAEPEKRRECEEKRVKMPSARVLIRGIAGGILNEGLTRKITGMAFMTPVAAFVPDPEGTTGLIKTMNKVYNLRISVEKLLKQASAQKRTMKEISESYQRMRKECRKGSTCR